MKLLNSKPDTSHSRSTLSGNFNLLTAGPALKTLLHKLSEKKSKFANKMTDALKLRIWEQWCMKLSGVVNYLYNPRWDNLSAEIGSLLPILNETVIKKHIKPIIERLSSVDNENLEDIEIMPSKFSTKQQSDNQTYKEKL